RFPAAHQARAGEGTAVRPHPRAWLLALAAIASAATTSPVPAPIAWLQDEPRALEQARRSGKPLLIDFRAEWCGACKMLDARTWSDPAVRAEVAARFVPLQIDLTNEEDEATQRLAKRYGVSGLPTVLAGERRVVGFVRAKEMLALLRAAGK